MPIEPPHLHYTPKDHIPDVVNQVHESFQSHTTRPVSFRLKELRKLYWR